MKIRTCAGITFQSPQTPVYHKSTVHNASFWLYIFSMFSRLCQQSFLGCSSCGNNLAFLNGYHTDTIWGRKIKIFPKLDYLNPQRFLIPSFVQQLWQSKIELGNYFFCNPVSTQSSMLPIYICTLWHNTNWTVLSGSSKPTGRLGAKRFLLIIFCSSKCKQNTCVTLI